MIKLIFHLTGKSPGLGFRIRQKPEAGIPDSKHTVLTRIRNKYIPIQAYPSNTYEYLKRKLCLPVVYKEHKYANMVKIYLRTGTLRTSKWL